MRLNCSACSRSHLKSRKGFSAWMMTIFAHRFWTNADFKSRPASFSVMAAAHSLTPQDRRRWTKRGTDCILRFMVRRFMPKYLHILPSDPDPDDTTLFEQFNPPMPANYYYLLLDYS